jgi:hypothetical protein
MNDEQKRRSSLLLPDEESSVGAARFMAARSFGRI